MNQEKYRLKAQKHHRQDTDPNDKLQPKIVTLYRGDVFIPTDAELKFHRNILEGPLPADTPMGVSVSETTQVVEESKAEQILKMSEANIRDEIRKADEKLLNAIADTEAHRPQPRKKVQDMIERRRSAFAQVAV